MQPKIILDPRKMTTTGPNKGRYPVKIKASIPVIEGGKKVWKPRRAKTGVYATPAEFKTMMGDRPGSRQADRDRLDELKQKAKAVCKIPGISPDQYIMYMEGKGNFESITGMFEWYIAECRKEDPETGEARDGNADALQNAMSFFVRYKGGAHITYAEITKEWLEDCKRWALGEIKDADGLVVKKKVTSTTFYMHCRALRTVMNLAVDPFGKITKESVPFGEGKSKFKIPSSKKKRKVKLELPTAKLIEQRDKILNFQVPKDSHYYAMESYLNYWKAAYFGNGANMADVLRWRFRDIKMIGDAKVIVFERKKTVNTEEESGPISVFVGSELDAIITKEGNKSLDPDEFIFPVLNKSMNSAERKKAVMKFIWSMNRSLKRAAKKMGLEIKLSSGSPRYLMSTLIDRSGIPKSVIKELLGHNTEQMQDHYVSPYMLDLMKSVNKILAG
jgi:integrase/recombinase XerD